MTFRENGTIPGVIEIKLEPRRDERGFFMRTFDEMTFMKNGLHRHWVQENHSRSEKKGVIRGLHFQFPPYAETKLIRCIRGSAMDVFVDLRKDSPSFGKWGSVLLSAHEFNMIYIPRGLAHGFCTLEPKSEIIYKVDNAYSPNHECGLLWNDPDLAIPWRVTQPVVSAKDAGNLTLKEFVLKYGAIDQKENK